MTLAPCPSDFALEALILGELSARQSDVAGHVAACAVCRAKVAAKREDDGEFNGSPEAATIRRALFRPRGAAPSPAKEPRPARAFVVTALAALAVLALSVGVAQRLRGPVVATSSSPSGSREEEEVLRVQREWMEAIRDKDVAALDRILTADYTYTDSRGGVTGKADSLRQARSTNDRMKAFRTTETKAQVYGDTAVVTGRLWVLGEVEGKPYQGEVRFTDILARIDGRWRAVAAHASRPVDERAP
jgi:ketosteroid isomerase-like protein